MPPRIRLARRGGEGGPVQSRPPRRPTGAAGVGASPAGAPARPVWLYSPMALDLARALEPSLLVYDVMDDLAAFAKAPPEMRERQREALETADVIFTGGRSLHRGVAGIRPDAHLFPSGIEPEHFGRAAAARTRHDRPVAGYVGVVDERLDLELIRRLAEL